MFFYKSNGNRFLFSLDWFPILVYLNGSFYLYIINTPYRIYFYTLHTRSYLSYILRFPVKGVKGGSIFVLLAWPKSTKNSRSYSFFCLDAKEPKNQGCVCWATPSLRFAVRAANSLRSAAMLQPLHSVPPLNAHQNEAGPSIDNWELTIDNFLFRFHLSMELALRL